MRWAEVRAVVDHDAGLCHIVARDITGRDAADAERLSEAFRDAPTGMAIIRTDGSFSRVNAALCTLLGRSEDELLASSALELAESPDDRRGLDDRPLGRRRAGVLRARGPHAHR